MLKVGFSFCPNDTFIFYALSKGKTCLGEVTPVMADVEELNRMIIKGELDVSKISIGVLPEVKDRYVLLECGGAFSDGEAPVVVSVSALSVDSISRLAIPGFHTTAWCMYRKFFGVPSEVVEKRYDLIIPAVLNGEVDAGILIHEGRFTYTEYGLNLVADLGEIWKERFGNLPVPLGGVVLKRDLLDLKGQVEAAIRESIAYSEKHLDEVIPFIKQHAQELSDEVIRKHIKVFVNNYTLRLDDKAKRAIDLLVSPM